MFLKEGKSNLTYLLIVAVLAAVAGGGILWFLQQQILPYPSLEIKMPEKVKDETADWQTYRNEEYGFEVKYPSVLENGEPGCRISEIEDTIFIGPISLMFFDAQGLTLNEWIDRKISESEEDTKEMQERFKEAGYDNWQEFGSKLLSREEIFIAGEKAVKLSYQFIGAGFDLPATISVKRGDQIYDFRANDANLVGEECAAKFGKKPSEAMELMLSTFRFIEPTEKYQELREKLVLKFKDRIPQEWGETVSGVKTELDTEEKIIALTFDACGGPYGSAYDEKLISYLKDNQIPATLFINARWIDTNPDIFQELKDNPLFEIENHGMEHKPCSANGASAYGEKGTNSVEEVIDEVELSARKIEELTGNKPRYYRSGTAHYDEICVEIVEELGYQVVNYNTLGDAGATFSENQVKNALLSADSGAIVLFHMNQPRGETAEGVIAAIPILKERGYRFVQLSEYNLK